MTPFPSTPGVFSSLGAPELADGLKKFAPTFVRPPGLINLVTPI